MNIAFRIFHYEIRSMVKNSLITSQKKYSIEFFLVRDLKRSYAPTSNSCHLKNSTFLEPYAWWYHRKLKVELSRYGCTLPSSCYKKSFCLDHPEVEHLMNRNSITYIERSVKYTMLHPQRWRDRPDLCDNIVLVVFHFYIGSSRMLLFVNKVLNNDFNQTRARKFCCLIELFCTRTVLYRARVLLHRTAIWSFTPLWENMALFCRDLSQKKVQI